MDFPVAAPILEAVGMAEAVNRPLDVAELAAELDLDTGAVATHVAQLEAWGLLALGLEAGDAPTLLTAGRQHLRDRGRTDYAVLSFLPHVYSDLNSRRAVLGAGTIVVGEFRASVLGGKAVAHARDLVPEAFRPAITEPLAMDLFAAAVALVARLTHGAAAACVAEEILVVELLSTAATWLDDEAAEGRLDPDEARAASDELSALFGLLEDDDVLDLFEMAAPADGAAASQADRDQPMGVVDQRVEAWFAPFHGATPTGHLRAPR